ncbi:MAG: GAF and ANTAR domain-containing protein [Dermatophilaceae bacterium]|nr:GAF and ANTAR domain-containing protein [Dermatophilaceae bacterium]NUR79219.1 GAF and ANTAR domain-containing protein [Dermatophilaceae bacterium]
MDNRTQPTELASDFEALNEYLGDGADGADALARLVKLAVVSVPGCDWAGLTAWPLDRRPRSLASTDPVAAKVDELQYSLGEGPCLEAAAEDDPVCIPDLSVDRRWKRFSVAASRRTPVRSVLAFHLGPPPDRAALNLYSATPHGFDDNSLVPGALFASHARVLIMHAGHADQASHLKDALTTSRRIGMAIGILMNVHKVTEDEAFALLRATSQNLNVKLRLVADDVARKGTLPRTARDLDE